MAKRKPQSVNVYIPFQAKAQGHLLLRAAADIRLLDIFPNRRKARPYLLAQEKASGTGALRLKKLRVFDLAHSMSALSGELSVDMLVFEGQTFPLTEAAVPEALDGPWATKALWETFFAEGGERGLAFATSWWWLSLAHGFYPVLNEGILEDFKALSMQEDLEQPPLSPELLGEADSEEVPPESAV